MKKKMEYKELYKTKDSELASLLYAKKQALDSSYRENGSVFFIFEDSENCERIVADYYRGKITINAKELFDSIKTIKSIIYSK